MTWNYCAYFDGSPNCVELGSKNGTQTFLMDTIRIRRLCAIEISEAYVVAFCIRIFRSSLFLIHFFSLYLSLFLSVGMESYGVHSFLLGKWFPLARLITLNVIGICNRYGLHSCMCLMKSRKCMCIGCFMYGIRIIGLDWANRAIGEW